MQVCIYVYMQRELYTYPVSQPAGLTYSVYLVAAGLGLTPPNPHFLIYLLKVRLMEAEFVRLKKAVGCELGSR